MCFFRRLVFPILRLWHTKNVTTTPRNTIILSRISDARDGDTKGVDSQQHDGRQLASRLSWGLGPDATHNIAENDTSAFKRKVITLPDGSTGLRTVRPRFREALRMLAAGEADGLIAYDLDRTCRDPRDLEDLIDVVERYKIPVESVTGSLKLANDADVTMARVMVAIANKSSRDTGRRVARARLRQATEGTFGGGKRRFGYDATGMELVASEAAEITRMADAFLAGESLRSLVRDLTAREVPTVTGAAWSTRTVREILTRPRNAGLSVSNGKIAGEAKWPAIMTADLLRALTDKMKDPSRKSGPGNTPRHLGSMIYRCGACDDGSTLIMQGSTKRDQSYRCGPKANLRRNAASLDTFVEAHIIAYLERPEAADLITPAHGADTAALTRETNELSARSSSIARMVADGTFTEAEARSGKQVINKRLAEIDEQLSRATAGNALAGIAGRSDARQIWDQLPVGRKREILREILIVTVYPARLGRMPGGARFDADSVKIEQKKPLPVTAVTAA